MFVEFRQILPCGAHCFCFLGCFSENPPRGGKRQRSSLSALINNRIWESVIEKKPERDKKRKQKSS